MTLHAVIQRLKKLPADKQAYVSKIILKLEDDGATKRKRHEVHNLDLWATLDAGQFRSGDGCLSEDVERFTGRRF